MKASINAAVVQFDVLKGAVEHNVKTVLEKLESLAPQGVDLAVFPEMFSCSFDNEHLKKHAQETAEIIEQLSSFAHANKMAIAGTIPEFSNGKIHNTMVFIDIDGQVKGRYHKLHLFRLTGEHLYYEPGNKVCIVESNLGAVGLMTCYDLRFPELARTLCNKGAQLIIVSAQWPAARKTHWETLIRARAIENQLYMVCSNRTGVEDDLNFPGMSMIADPLGETVAKMDDHPGTAAGTIEFDKVREFRRLIPCGSDRRPDIYG